MSRIIATPLEPAGSPNATETAAPEMAKPGRVSWWVKVFVAFHIVAITIWAIPDPPLKYRDGTKNWTLEKDNLPDLAQSLNDGLRVYNWARLKPSPVKYYLLPTGLWQYWDMFAPNPANVDFFGDADVIYKDGSVKVYNYPRMYSLGLFQKYAMERFRKYYERANDGTYQYTWPAFAQRVALLSTTDPNNPPVEVHLRRHLREIVAPGKPQPEEYSNVEYFRYRVDEEKLKQDLKGGS